MPDTAAKSSHFDLKYSRSILTLVLSTALCIVLHQFAPDPEKENITLSIFYANGLFMPLMAIDLLVTFSLLAVVFRFIAARSNVSSLALGIRFGLSLSLLWLLGFLEGNLYYGSSVKHDILHGLSDAITMMIMFPALGALWNKKSANKPKRPVPIAIFVIALFYFLGRYFLYSVLRIDSAVNERPLEMLAWTAAIGVSVGILFSLASESIAAYSPLKRALVFSFFIFGIDWLMYYSFAPIIQSISLLDNFMRPAIDILFTGIGAFVCGTIALTDRKFFSGVAFGKPM